MARSGPTPLIDEMKFVARTTEEMLALSEDLVEKAEVSENLADTIVVFLARLQRKVEQGVPRTNSDRARASQYRVFLARLGAPPWDREPNEAMGASRRSTDVVHRRRRRILAARGAVARRPAA